MNLRIKSFLTIFLILLIIAGIITFPHLKTIYYDFQFKKAIKLLQQGRKTEALNILKNLPKIKESELNFPESQLNPAKAKIIAALAFNKLASKEYNDAIKLFEEARKLDPSVDVVDYLAFAYLMTGQKNKALELLNDAIAKEPNNPRHFEFRGVVYASLGNKEKAQSDLKKVLLIDPNYPGQSRVIKLLESLK